MKHKIVDVDLLKVYRKEGKKKVVVTVLAWGDPILVGDPNDNDIPVSVSTRIKEKDGSVRSESVNGFVSKKAKFMDPAKNDVMRFSVVDVGQGDASVLETPGGKLMLVDGGVDKLFARYLAARFHDTSPENPREVEAIVVTHGDADHFAGLAEIHKSQDHSDPQKRIFIHPKAVLHNGLVKRSGQKDPLKAFGRTVKSKGDAYVVDLVDDLLTLPKAEMNKPFREWAGVLSDWSKKDRVVIERLSDRTKHTPFASLQNEGIQVDVLAPIEESVNREAALPLLHTPLKTVPESQGEEVGSNLKLSKTYSVSHTINGHSIVLLLKYGNIRLLLTGDLNAESESILLKRSQKGSIRLESDFLKVPHHGSADFDAAFLQEVKPVVSVISSGDENERQEYIHPRAPLVGALGKQSRVSQPLIFVTEMVAFYKSRGRAALIDKNRNLKSEPFFSFEKTSYGIVHLAFNKERMLVFTHSGKRDLKEAYAFTVSRQGKVIFEKVRQV